MKLLTYKTSASAKEQLGVMNVSDTRIIPLCELGMDYKCMNDLIDNISEHEMKKLAEVSLTAGEAYQTCAYEETVHCAPIPMPKQDVICLGVNYAEHAKESARYKNETYEEKREYAVYFSKRVNEAIGDQAPIDGHLEMLERLDYEVELAVILGKEAWKVSAEDAFDYVFGYTILNDMSARDIQMRHKQWYFGKSIDTFCPMGPWIVTKDEFENPPVLKISSKINGELRQNSCTDMLIFSIAQVIEELSHGMKLKAGTIISMGTPAGVGLGFDPPKFLKAGDVVCCEIEKIGTLTNTIQ